MADHRNDATLDNANDEDRRRLDCSPSPLGVKSFSGQATVWTEKEMQNRTFILMWRHGVSPEIRWFLRGITVRENGSFYGELFSAWELTRIIDGSPAKGIGKTI